MRKLALVRPAAAADAPAIESIWLASVESAELPGLDRELVSFLTRRLEVETTGVYVAERDGAVIGFLHADSHVVVVDRDHRRQHVGRRLVDYAEADIRNGSQRLLLWLPDDRPTATAFFDAGGFAYVASLWQLTLPSGADLPSPDFGSGLASKREDEVEVDALVALFNDVFAEHPTPMRTSRDIVEWSRAQPTFDPSNFLVLVDSSVGEPIALARVAHEHGDGEPGEIKFIGVKREWRGKGLGRALLIWGVRRVEELGARGASLLVEGENERAYVLYAQVGFEPEHEWRRFGR